MTDFLPADRSALDGGTASANQLEHQRDNRQHQKNVNEPTQRVAADDAEQPQDEQNYKDCPKHFLTLTDVDSLLTSEPTALLKLRRYLGAESRVKVGENPAETVIRMFIF
jgi:hypothetical protein